MKYRKKGIKKEHHIIEEGEQLLNELVKNRLVKSVIPGRIKTTPKGKPGNPRLTYQYDTKSGAKLLLKKGSTVQEVFVITDDRESLRKFIEERFKS
ncbi:MAG TPA: hypothetical protein DEP48_04960 [Persephonella sp.]|uniref:Metal-binding protein n=1 Tax=Persephonella marina (strain DSM 14350 / EX-H1) TaxID=123214 RepID=C0QPV1_PERMH|nr:MULTISPECIES: DUF2103 domain-containing protein [Persephonella]ACO04230.1 conserved hypothetical protein [Persephonella marina EX-H1]HCB69688.1 hypothetical protein [Persephonella sp.]